MIQEAMQSMLYHSLNDKRLKTITFPFDNGSYPTYYIPAEASDLINDSLVSGETVKDAFDNIDLELSTKVDFSDFSPDDKTSDMTQSVGKDKNGKLWTKPVDVEKVEEWLEDNITQETGYVIDNSLSVSGAAADAKAVGNAINNLGNMSTLIYLIVSDK